MTDNRNTILAVILSGLVLIAWQYFYNMPQMEKQRAAQQAQSELAKPAPQPGTTTAPATTPQTGTAPAPSANAPATNQPASAAPVARDTAVASTPRVKIDTPHVAGYYILHEGLIGYLGDQGLQEYGYKKIDDAKAVSLKVTNGWLGITDKYWASALLPDTTAQLQARLSSNLVGAIRTYQTDYLEDPQTIAIGSTATGNARLFAV